MVRLVRCEAVCTLTLEESELDAWVFLGYLI